MHLLSNKLYTLDPHHYKRKISYHCFAKTSSYETRSTKGFMIIYAQSINTLLIMPFRNQIYTIALGIWHMHMNVHIMLKQDIRFQDLHTITPIE